LSVLNQTPCCRLLVWSYFLIEQLSADIIHIVLCLVLLRFRNCRWWSATLGFKGKTLVFDSFSAVRITPCKLYMYTTVVWFNILIQTHTHTRSTALFPGLPRWAGTRKVTPIWVFVKQETVSGSGISWAICKSAPCSRQITMPAPHQSAFYRPDALPAAQPTVSEHWRR